MVEVLKFIEELKQIKTLCCQGSLLGQKETYDILRNVQNLINKYEKEVELFELEHSPTQLELEL